MSSKQLTNSALGTIIYPLTNGPVAQLGAHHIRIVGVVGSNPIRSTNRKTLVHGTRVFVVFGKPNVKAGLVSAERTIGNTTVIGRYHIEFNIIP